MPTPKWPSFSPLEAILVSTCKWGGSRYRRGDVRVKVGIGRICCSADVILSPRCLRFRPLFTNCVPRFASRPGDAASRSRSFQGTAPPICYGTVTQFVAEEGVCNRVPRRILLNPLWGRNRSFWFLRCSARGPGCVFKAAAAATAAENTASLS